jgi:hypothetical protein
MIRPDPGQYLAHENPGIQAFTAVDGLEYFLGICPGGNQPGGATESFGAPVVYMTEKPRVRSKPEKEQFSLLRGNANPQGFDKLKDQNGCGRGLRIQIEQRGGTVPRDVVVNYGYGESFQKRFQIPRTSPGITVEEDHPAVFPILFPRLGGKFPGIGHYFGTLKGAG